MHVHVHVYVQVCMSKGVNEYNLSPEYHTVCSTVYIGIAMVFPH